MTFILRIIWDPQIATVGKIKIFNAFDTYTSNNLCIS
jgi:hypothetical protein